MNFFGISVETLVTAGGYLGFFAIIFAESGLLVGVALPGDSLLFTAGFLASQGFFAIVPLAALATIAAILGDNIGYAFGRRVGTRLFTRPRSRFFRPEYAERAGVFYDTHGPRAIMLGRFIPVVRTFAPILAGVGKMPYGIFLFYNILGGVVWGAGLTMVGYFLGSTIPNVDHYLLPIILGIVVMSLLPGALPLARGWRRKRRARLRG